jgi:hypothetical protein
MERRVMDDDAYPALRLKLVALNELIDDQRRFLDRLTARRLEITHQLAKLRGDAK